MSDRSIGSAGLAARLLACLWVAVFATPAWPAGFQVVGLVHSAVRMKQPLGDKALLWMGDRLGGPEREPEWVRVDDQAALAIQFGEEWPQGALLEFSEFSLFAAADTSVHFGAGRARIVSGVPFTLTSPFGSFALQPNSIVDVEAGGQRMHVYCLMGEVSVEHEDQRMAAAAGTMIRAPAGGKPEVLPIPPEIRRALESKPRLPLRYSARGERVPRIRWFSPRAGRISDREKITVLGRADRSDGAVEATVEGAPVRWSADGNFSAAVTLRPGQDTLSAQFRRDAAVATLSVRIGVDVAPPVLAMDPVSETTALKQILLSGKLNEPAALFCGGKPVTTRDGQFNFIRDLEPGPNSIRLLAFDRAGHRADHTLLVFRQAALARAGGEGSADGPRTAGAGPDTSPPGDPPSLRLSGIAGGVSLEFEDILPRGSRYRIYRSYSTDGPFVVVGETEEPSFIDGEKIDPGLSYYYRASIVGDLGQESPMSDPVRFTAAPAELRPPNSVAYRVDGRRLWLTWPRAGGFEIGGYNVYRIDAAGPVRVASLASSPYVTDLPDTFSELHYRVRALSAFSLEESDWSDTVRVKR
ncbi:MAG: hypothetical protein A3G34_08990 [Candidatus Lindowbacteria bacterium RIFCSPLOWO2_12_FULL_62_27]|nr:MAG: hypothetical protein A3G34_08990 [Candidatus Lindowbacteria bacterium RIFCSPLOWO2_12_FULL_62_27]